MKMHVITVFGQKDLMKLDSKEFNTSITSLKSNVLEISSLDPTIIMIQS